MVRFILRRRRGYFMLQIYAPCALIVSASWVSFWIHRADAAGRVSVGATTVLTLVTMGFGGRANLPRVTYATALDWFIVLCFTFVFTAMVEYACVNFVDHKQLEQIRQMLDYKLRQSNVRTRVVDTTEEVDVVEIEEKARIRLIIAFPLLFPLLPFFLSFLLFLLSSVISPFLTFFHF
jgi:hypothetical protein